ncbi:MAG: MGMT family protein [Lentisphaeraceae bacterium]|nr:MGMT family protein [Lentisphaeraceae bacterium]
MTEFRQKCYDALMKIPKGKVTTYSELAKAVGTKAVRAVGTAMAKNEKLIKVPCHRVVRSDGSIGQYAMGTARKIELLESEGVMLDQGKIKDFDKFLFKFINDK